MGQLGGLLCVLVPLLLLTGLLYVIGALPTVIQSFRIAIDMLRLHKLRAFLTMLGVIIGVMSVTLIVMISNGFQGFITSEFKRLGSDTIIVAYDRWSTKEKTEIEGLKLDDIDYLMDQVPQLDLAAPILQLPAKKVNAGEQEVKDTRVFATNENFDELNRVQIVKGRSISKDDKDFRENVCVIGPEIEEKLFQNDGIGKTLQLEGITLEVIGVVERLDIMGQTNARDVLLPITTAQDKWVGGDTVSMITTRPKEGYKVSETVEEVWQAMMRRSGNKKIYRVDSRESILAIFGSILGGTGMVLAGIAALSLLVGGIGIMNIMLVSVTERTREIGLRKAVGAKKAAILTQFLVESAVLSMIGGAMGMATAWVFGQGISALTKVYKMPSEAGLQMTFPLPAAIVAMLFSALIGITFGFFPALSAARLNPIDALRKE